MVVAEKGKAKRVSVIVPVYNGGDYIQPCLESIAAQSFRDFELLVVNDGSTDMTGERVDAFFSRNPGISGRQIRQENRGIMQARRTGVEAAGGDWIAFVDADDWVDPKHLQGLTRAVEETGADIACCGYIEETIGSGDRTKKRWFPVWKNKEKLNRGCLSAGDALYAIWSREGLYQYAWNKLFRRSLFDSVDFLQGNPIGEDFYLITHTLREPVRVCVVDMETYHYRVHPKSMTQESTGDGRWQGYVLYRQMREKWHMDKRVLSHSDTNSDSTGGPNRFFNEEDARALDRYLMLEYMACLLTQYRSGIRHEEEEKEILKFVREHRRDYIRHSHDGFAAKCLARLLGPRTSRFFFRFWSRRRRPTKRDTSRRAIFPGGGRT